MENVETEFLYQKKNLETEFQYIGLLYCETNIYLLSKSHVQSK